MSAKGHKLAKPSDDVTGKRQWRTPVLTKVPLNDRQWMDLDFINELNDPEEDDEFLGNWVEGLPDTDILAALPATHVTLAPITGLLEMTSPLWFQLAKEDRRALQTIYIHEGAVQIAYRKPNTAETWKRQSDQHWLRWLAVREALRQGDSSEKARETASTWLEDTPADGTQATMKWSYELVLRILRPVMLRTPEASL